MAGRSSRQVNSQARALQLPLTGRTIDLSKAARAIHDLLSENAAALSKRGNKAEQLAENDPLRLLRIENWRIRRLERQDLESELLSRVQVRDMLSILHESLRDTCGKLKKKCGAAPAGILAEALENMERQAESFFDETENAETASKTY